MYVEMGAELHLVCYSSFTYLKKYNLFNTYQKIFIAASLSGMEKKDRQNFLNKCENFNFMNNKCYECCSYKIYYI